MIKVLFVCMGNICRSPTVEGVFRSVVKARGLSKKVFIDSAGTHGYHVGDPPDSRAQAVASARGYDICALKGRQVCLQDFQNFDYILAMDLENLIHLQKMCPPEHTAKLCLLMDYARHTSEREVPDPYYGGTRGFEKVLDMAEDAAQGLADEIQGVVARKQSRGK